MKTPIQETMTAIREGTLLDFQQLLAQHPTILPENGIDLLEHAAENNRIDILGLLISAGVDVNGATSLSSPLTAAAREATVETVQWLLDHGADVNLKPDERSSTPLEEAIVEGRLKMVEFLLDHGADPNILHGSPKRNALASANFWSETEIADYLESRGIPEIIIHPDPIDVESPSFINQIQTLTHVNWFDKLWLPVYEQGVKHGLASMCEKNQVLFLVGYLIDQLADGGAEMVYSNPSAEYTSEMPPALDKIGASQAADAIRAVNALFPDGAPDHDYVKRAMQIEAIRPKFLTLAEKLDLIFDEWLPDGGERRLVVQLYDFYRA